MLESVPFLKSITAPARRIVSKKIDQRIRKFTETVPISEFSVNDIFVVGYPKSGNTWFQNIMAGLAYGVNPGQTPDQVVQDLVPDVHYKRYYRRYSETMFFKSHFFPRPDYRKVIYIVRDGRDVMVSYFHYLQALKSQKDISINFEQMLLEREGLFQRRFWHEHIEAWLSNPYQAELIVVRYEDMLSNFAEELEKICQFFDIDVSKKRLEELGQQTAFKKMQSKEIKFGVNNPAWPQEKRFVRRGKAGSYKDEMPPALQRAFLEQASDFLLKLDYVL